MKQKKDKPFEKLQEVADYASTTLRKVLFLQGWELDFSRIESTDNIAAECTPDWSYKRATLRFYPPFFKESLDQQKEIILHEMLHIITGVQNALLCKAHDGQYVSPSERHEAFEHETSWLTHIIADLL